MKKDGNQTPSPSNSSPRKGLKARLRLKTRSYPLVKSLEGGSSEAAPLELPPDSLTEHLAQVAPLSVAAAVGLPPGATYQQCLRQRLLTSAIVDADASVLKELLTRLEGEAAKAAKRNVLITVRYDDIKKKLLGGTEDPRFTWEYWCEQRLSFEGLTAELAAWRAMPRELKLALWKEIVGGLGPLPAEKADGAKTVVN